MEQETSFVIYEGIVVPESALCRRERSRCSPFPESVHDECMAHRDDGSP